jgi:hypothetical protein
LIFHLAIACLSIVAGFNGGLWALLGVPLIRRGSFFSFFLPKMGRKVELFLVAYNLKNLEYYHRQF